MTKNGQMRAGWETVSPRKGHSSHSYWLTREKEGSEIQQSGTGFVSSPAQRNYDLVRQWLVSDCEAGKWDHIRSSLASVSFTRPCYTNSNTLPRVIPYHTLRWASVRMWWYSQYSFHQVSGLTNLFIHDLEQHSFNPQFKDSNVCLAFSSRLQFSLNLKQKSWEMIKQCGENQSMWLKWRN